MFATEQCLLVLTHHPAVWHQAAQFLDQSSKALADKGVRIVFLLFKDLKFHRICLKMAVSIKLLNKDCNLKELLINIEISKSHISLQKNSNKWIFLFRKNKKMSICIKELALQRTKRKINKKRIHFMVFKSSK